MSLAAPRCCASKICRREIPARARCACVSRRSASTARKCCSGRGSTSKRRPTRRGSDMKRRASSMPWATVCRCGRGDVVSVVPAFSMNEYGVYGEQATVPARAVVKTPPGVSPVEAAALWMQDLTAYGALIELGGLAAGDVVVIPAASSSVGLAAIQIARLVGATPIATTRTGAKKRALFDAGAPHVIATQEEDLVSEVMRLTHGQGARLVFDPVAGPYVETLADATAKGGTIFLYGILSLQPTPFPLFKALSKGLVLRGYTLFEITSDPERLSSGVAFVTQGLTEGALKPIIARIFPLGEIVEAHRFMESNEQIGKIVVTVEREA